MAENLYNIRIQYKGSPIQVYIKSLLQEFSNEHFKRNLQAIKNTVLKDVEMYINSKRQRKGEIHDEGWRTTKRNNLYNAIEAGTTIKTTGNTHSLSIGSKTYLKRHAPYWAMINYGGKIDMKGKQLYGWFDRGLPPMSSMMGGDSVFKKGYKHNYKLHGGYGYPMNPKTLIPPMYYLDRMAQVFETEVAILEAYYKRQIKYAAERKATSK